MALMISPLAGYALENRSNTDDVLTLFLSGDVMTGRGIDQVLPHSVDPKLHERYVKDARRYVQLARQKHGSIPDEVSYEYIWGDALDVLSRIKPKIRIINLETSVTTSDDWWKAKGIHYRMHPQNVTLFTTAGIDVCVLGNNHVMDYGTNGLRETLNVLQKAGLKTAGAGIDEESASGPAVVHTGSNRILIFSYGMPSAGVSRGWSAQKNKPGVNLMPDLSEQSSQRVINGVEQYRQNGDRVIISIHWGSNWGYDIPPEQRDFAHRLIDAGAADIIHGHSSHHPKGIEVYEDRLILYGAGDLINDYEGIDGRQQYRSDLSLMYFPKLDSSGELLSLEMSPMKIRNFQLHKATKEQAQWLADTLDRKSETPGISIGLNEEVHVELSWR